MTHKKYSEIKKDFEIAGYWDDVLSLDRKIIENRKCKCGAYFLYKGFSNPTEYQAFGVCEPCDYAKHFWTEKAEFAAAKKQFSGGKIYVRSSKIG